MSKFNPLWLPKPPVILSYGVAVLSVIAALIIAWWIESVWQSVPHVSVFLCAVMFSAWFGGMRPGLLAIALSVLAFDYYFLPPIYSWALKPQELPRLLFFALSAFFVGSLTAAQRRAAESLRDTRDDLHRTVQDLKRINEALQAENTERKRAEDALRASEHSLRLLVDNIPGFVFVTSAEGELEYVNQRILDYTGKSLADLAGLRWSSVIHPVDLQPALASWFECVATGRPHEAEWRFLRADGADRWFHNRVEPLRGDGGLVIRWYGLLQDVDDQKNAEEALRRSQAELAHVTRVTTLAGMTASIADEINQPLAAVVNNASACLRWRAANNLEEARCSSEATVTIN